MSNHEIDLVEVVGSHGWRAILREADDFLKAHESVLYAQAVEEFDFIKKEVAAGVIRELRRFFAGVEQKADEIARRPESD